MTPKKLFLCASMEILEHIQTKRRVGSVFDPAIFLIVGGFSTHHTGSIPDVQRLDMAVEAVQTGDEGVIGGGLFDGFHRCVIIRHIGIVGGRIPGSDADTA